jgi:hypothetical protein
MKPLLLFITIVVSTTVCLAQDNIYDESVRRASIHEDSDYAHPLAVLKQVVAEKAKSRRNTFYVSRVYYFGNGASNAMVYWKEGRALILWEPHLAGTDRRHELVWSRRFLSLDKDVVPTLTDVGGSNYLITRDWTRQVLRDCVHNGAKFVLYVPSRKHRTAQSNKRFQRTHR